ncbi:hypothetical protein STXM2123_4426 [Streptomyces sp. F-3]|nr:hypothetical protein STXM2123_4426 [Streptomyces sp. F-3]
MNPVVHHKSGHTTLRRHANRRRSSAPARSYAVARCHCTG